MDDLKYGQGRITVKEAARLMRVNENFVRIGLQQEKFNFGVAVQKEKGGRFTYHISPAKFYEYLYGNFKKEN